MSNSTPLVTVTFVGWQRRELLRQGIESALAQDYPAVEILVLDNSPTDEIHRWLLDEYPQVKAVKTWQPVPLPAARNLLVATARGELVVFHDDDSRFSSPTDLSAAVAYLQPRPDVACLAFRVGNGDEDWNPQFDGPEPAPTYNYVACAVLFRKADYIRAGGYFEGYPLYGEERILSLGFFAISREIHFFPEVSIIHTQVMDGRDRDPGARYELADMAMVPGAALLRFPFPEVLVCYPASLAWLCVKIGVIRRRPWLALRGLFHALSYLPAFLRERRAMPRREFRRWLKTRREYNRAYYRRVREHRPAVSRATTLNPVGESAR